MEGDGGDKVEGGGGGCGRESCMWCVEAAGRGLCVRGAVVFPAEALSHSRPCLVEERNAQCTHTRTHTYTSTHILSSLSLSNTLQTVLTFTPSSTET